jgi:hypothetical protein
MDPSGGTDGGVRSLLHPPKMPVINIDRYTNLIAFITVFIKSPKIMKNPNFKEIFFTTPNTRHPKPDT